MPSPGRTSYYVFTLNNPTSEDELALRRLCIQGEVGISYCIYGRETGESGTRHLQGYIEFSRRLRFDRVKRILGQRYHLEARLGTAQEAAEYCRKEDESPYEYGTISVSSQGKRTDLESLHESLKDKKSLSYVADEHFGAFIKYQRGINAYRLVTSTRRDPQYPPSVVVYWGRTGTGKTRAVWDNAVSPSDVWVYAGSGWFDGYDGQPIALFDDFSGSEFKISYLLKVLDRYPMQVPVKGGFVNWTPQEIYLTSNLDPSVWYMNASQEHVAALRRRFSHVVFFE